jgi:hypothetical protein
MRAKRAGQRSSKRRPQLGGRRPAQGKNWHEASRHGASGGASGSAVRRRVRARGRVAKREYIVACRAGAFTQAKRAVCVLDGTVLPHQPVGAAAAPAGGKGCAVVNDSSSPGLIASPI